MKINTAFQTWSMREPFVISRGSSEDQPTLIVTVIDDDGFRGRGEACGVDYAGETPQSMADQIEAIAAHLKAGITRSELLVLLPAGGARNSLDAALWDLEAKRSGMPAIDLSAFPMETAFTIGIRSLGAYEETAARFADWPLLKVKVGPGDPVAAIEAVLRGAPNARLIVDPNQAWTVDQLKQWAPVLADRQVSLLEQPVAVGAEAALDDWDCPLPLCADEVLNDQHDLSKVVGRFSHINIKLDKTGGLTAALALADAAEAMGLKLMVGCMAGSSLAMAPGLVLGPRCDFVDLDGPLLQAADVDDGLIYQAGRILPPTRELWG